MSTDAQGLFHDLKNKLTIISSSAQRLEKYVEVNSARKYINSILSASEVCDKILNSVELRSLKRKKSLEKWEDERAVSFVEKFLSLHKKDFESLYHLNIVVKKKTIDHSAQLRIKKELVHQIISNILENSHIHGATLATITFSQGKKFFYIEISDNGKGIAPENICKIGNGFSSQSGSHGHGTKIVRMGMLELGGDVEWRSDEKGATALLLFPVMNK